MDGLRKISSISRPKLGTIDYGTLENLFFLGGMQQIVYIMRSIIVIFWVLGKFVELSALDYS